MGGAAVETAQLTKRRTPFSMFPGEKDCTLAPNFGGGAEREDIVPARLYEPPLLLKPDPNTLILEAHIHSNPKPKVTWMCNGDLLAESERKMSRLEPMEEANKWRVRLIIMPPDHCFHGTLHNVSDGFYGLFTSTALRKPSAEADSGDYKCSMKNKWGSDHTTFALG